MLKILRFKRAVEAYARKMQIPAVEVLQDIADDPAPYRSMPEFKDVL